MGERPVGFRHTMGIFALFDGDTRLVEGVHNLEGETLPHRSFRTGTRTLEEPLDRKRFSSSGTHLYRNLIVCATYPARLYLEIGFTFSIACSKTLSGSSLGSFS